METLYQSIARHRNSQNTAVYFENKVIRFPELFRNIDKMVTYFQNKGVRPGDVITVALPNIPTMIYAFYALDALGVIQNIIHPLTPVPKIIETMENTKSKAAIILETEYQDNVELFNNSPFDFYFLNPMADKSFLMKHAFHLKFKKVRETERLFALDKYLKEKPCQNIVHRNPKETSIYLHSGGTTGTPKVIELSDEAINNLASRINSIVNKDLQGKAMLAVLPTFHGFGLGMGIHAPLYVNAATSIMIKFNAKKIVKWINQDRVNVIIGVPLLYEKLLENVEFQNAKLKNLDFCFIGGDNVSSSLIVDFNTLMKNRNSPCKLLEGYGLTETVTVCTVNTKENDRLGSVGKALENMIITIRDDNFKEVKRQEIGEVYIHADTIMNGYLNDLKATKETLIELDNRLWVRTGDLGYLDDEDYLFIKGRKKRVFKIGGINVYPSEVEKIVSNLKEVHNSSLEYFDSPKPHTVLFVIRNREFLGENDDLTMQIMDELNKHVLKYSLPSKVIYMESFPKTAIGKIDHKAFKEG